MWYNAAMVMWFMLHLWFLGIWAIKDGFSFDTTTYALALGCFAMSGVNKALARIEEVNKTEAKG